MIKAVRGTRDLLPPETALWNFVEAAVRDVFRAYNFHEIRTPIFEETELFARGVGEETDIVSKEMYTWEDRGRAASEKGQSLTLRPENTAGVVRAYIEHKLWDRGLNKLYYIGPQFRRERPQKGRYRQFYQIGAEVIGPAIGRQRISRARRRSSRTAGHATRSPRHQGLDSGTEFRRLPGRSRTLQRSPAQSARSGDGQDVRRLPAPRRDQSAARLRLQSARGSADHRDAAAHQPVSRRSLAASTSKQVQEILKSVGVPFQLNDRLVRGLDYYTRTAFEFTHGALGAQNAILGGGRYDGLSEALGGPAAPGIGFAIGEDRLVLSLQEIRPKQCSASPMSISRRSAQA